MTTTQSFDHRICLRVRALANRNMLPDDREGRFLRLVANLLQERVIALDAAVTANGADAHFEVGQIYRPAFGFVCSLAVNRTSLRFIPGEMEQHSPWSVEITRKNGSAYHGREKMPRQYRRAAPSRQFRSSNKLSTCCCGASRAARSEHERFSRILV